MDQFGYQFFTILGLRWVLDKIFEELGTSLDFDFYSELHLQSFCCTVNIVLIFISRHSFIPHFRHFLSFVTHLTFKAIMHNISLSTTGPSYWVHFARQADLLAHSSSLAHFSYFRFLMD